jgi:hypothetical protein
MENIIAVGDRTFVALRKARQSSSGRAAYHAVTPHNRMALCSAEPGAASGWAEPPAEAVTCSACIDRLRRLRGRHAAA